MDYIDYLCVDGVADAQDSLIFTEGRKGREEDLLRMNNSIKSALVLGLGVSGEAAAQLLVRDDFSVTVADGADESVFGNRCESLRSAGVEVLTGVRELPSDDFDLCVVSPGIDCGSVWVVEMESRGVEVVSELELGYRHCRCPLIAVTGTNGKSTLVKLLHEIFKAAGKKVEIAGNYGIPLCEVAERSECLDWIVAEVSSFQLEKVSQFHPRVGVLLNIQPDHLDRHGGMDEYRELKCRLFRCMEDGDTAIVHCDEIESVQYAVGDGCRRLSFGMSETADFLYTDIKKSVAGEDKNGSFEVDISGSGFDNPIMGQTAAAAVAAAVSCGLDSELVSDAVESFDRLSHRMEQVAVIKGITYIDDSKATNLAALKAGLEMSEYPVRLIAGGQLKEKSVKFVKEVLANKAVCVYVIGDAANVLMREWQDVVECLPCSDLDTAVCNARRDAKDGDTVILSPGCASFDQFESYRDRGEKFKRIVEIINEEEKHEDIICD